MTFSLAHSLALGMLLVAAGSVSMAQADRPSAEQTIQVNDHLTISPGYRVGNIAIAAPRVADYQVLPGRRDILVFGKSAGTTRLTVWDQRRVKRDEVLIRVVTPVSVRLERDLRAALAVYPAIQVTTLGDVLTLTGTADRQDQPFVSRIAAIAKAQDMVRYIDAADQATSVATAPPTSVASAPSAAGPPRRVHFELAFLEASSTFRTGSYATGVEPSGRLLSRCTIAVSVGEHRQLFIGNRADAPSVPDAAAGQSPCSDATPTSVSDRGVRVTIEPGVPTARGTIPLRVMVETNLPAPGQLSTPDAWRRARMQFTAANGEPLAVAGAELLAAPLVHDESLVRQAQRATATAATLPSIDRAPGLEYGNVLGRLLQSKSFKGRRTQLLLLLTPSVEAPGHAPRDQR